MALKTVPKNGKLYSLKGYTGIKVRYLTLSKNGKEDWSFYIYYRIGGRKGKQILKKIGTKSQGMTIRKAVKIRMLKITEQEQKNITSDKKLTILQIWEEYCKQKKHIPSFSAIKNLFSYLKPFYNKSPITINTNEIKLFRQNIAKQKSKSGILLSEQTIVHILKLLRTLINFSVKNGLCPKNEKLYVEIPTINNTVREYLSDKEIRAYINIIKNECNQYVRAFIMIALYTGMRRNAICHLAWNDIDEKNNLIYLNAQHAKKRQEDYIPLPLQVKRLLAKLPKKSRYIFIDENGKCFAPYFQRAKEIKEEIGLPKHYRPLYMLRHTFASILANNGMDLYTIQKLLTHNSPAMTQRYAHLNDKKLKSGSKLVSKIIQKYLQE